MNGCKEVRASFSEYLDGLLNGREMQLIAAHLDGCRECAREWELLRQAQLSLAELGPVPEPEDLLLRIRVALSQERARSLRGPFYGWGLAWKNTVGPFLFRASAGFASAVLLLGTLVVLVTTFTQPQMAQVSNQDVSPGAATAPRLLYLSSGAGSDGISGASSSVVVEAYVNDQGEVYDYRIVSGPTDAATRSQIENMLLFSVFAPARFLGQPVSGLAVLSFADISVRG